jgi:hypothetical protein
MYELSLLVKSEIEGNNGRYSHELLEFDSVLGLISRRSWRKDIYHSFYVGGSKDSEENKKGIMIRAGNYRFDYSLKTRDSKDAAEVRRALKRIDVTPRMLSLAIIIPGPNEELTKQFKEFRQWLNKA